MKEPNELYHVVSFLNRPAMGISISNALYECLASVGNDILYRAHTPFALRKDTFFPIIYPAKFGKKESELYLCKLRTYQAGVATKLYIPI